MAFNNGSSTFTYYNEKSDIRFKEYGRNVEAMVKHISSLPDKEQRTQMINALIGYLKRTNANIPLDTDEDQIRLWQHLHAITNYELDIDGKFPTPTIEDEPKRPAHIGYSDYKIKNRQYGRNLQLLVSNARKLTDAEEKEAAVIAIGKLLKNFYQQGNKDNIEDSSILNLIEEMSNGELTIDIEKVTEGNLFNLSKESLRMASPHPVQVDRKNRTVRKNYTKHSQFKR